MARFVSVRLTLDGDFRDAWLYKEYLYCWDSAGILHHASLDRLLSWVLRTRGPAIANLVEYLILRTDWKASGQFRSILRAPAMEKAFLEPFNENDSIKISIPYGLLSKSKSEAYSGGVLDTNIYADHVYIATTEGLLQTFVNPTEPDVPYSLQQVLDERVSRVNVRFSAVNASAGERGLHFCPLGIPAENQHQFTKHQFRLVAPRSHSSIHVGKSLLNYGSRIAPDLLRAHVSEKTISVSGRERESVLGYGDAVEIDALTITAITSNQLVEKRAVELPSNLNNFEILGNTDKRLLATWNDRLRVVDMRLTPSTPNESIKATLSKLYRKTRLSEIKPENIIQTLPVPGGFVVEQYDSVNLINSRGTFTLASDAVASVRTFTGSIRHREVVSIIGEDSMSFIGYYVTDETLL